MLFPQQADSKSLADFCRRMAMSLEAGIDIRKALASEVQRSSRSFKPHIEQIRDARKNFMHAIGSCSFEEPLQDLRSLGLL